jgi:nucleotide-binding universal stress UspA family protein
MFSTIVLAVDNSKHSARATEVVKQLAEATNAVVIVLHVHEIAIGRWGRLRIDDPSEDDFAAGIVAELSGAGVQARTEVREVNYRDIADAIARTADESNADLIVVGSRGRSDIGSLALGSVSHKLLHTSHRPVLVVPA